MLRRFDPAGSTADVDFFTTKEVYPTSERALPRQLRRARRAARKHLGGRQSPSSWRSLPQVAAYVKNDHLGFTIPYVLPGTQHAIPARLPRPAQAA